MSLVLAVAAVVFVAEVARLLPLPALARPPLLLGLGWLALQAPASWLEVIAVAGGALVVGNLARARSEGADVQATRLVRRTPRLPR